MQSLLKRWTYVLATSALATVLMASIADPASAQTQQDLKARCAQLVNFFDYYGVSRGENKRLNRACGRPDDQFESHGHGRVPLRAPMS